MEFNAHRCPNGHITFPGHPLCPKCGEAQSDTINLIEHTGEVITWTESTATPSGVRSPNTLAIVEFNVDGESVRALGQTTDDVEIGDKIEPVYVDELRKPGAGIKAVYSDQSWDGYRFKPV